jgi:hypothetical protein
MRLHPLVAACLVLSAPMCWADTAPDKPAAPPSPLRLVPAEADALVQVPKPRQVADLVRNLEILPAVMEFPAVKEQLTSTSARRARQLLAYFEKTLGSQWPELLEDLAGGGAVVATKFASNNAPVLLVVQGKDEKRMESFVKLATSLIEAELARQESKDKLEKITYHGVEVCKIGAGFWMARADAALLVSNRKDALARALDLHAGKEKKSMADHPGLAEAGKLLPSSPLAVGWLNMRPIQQSEGGKAIYAMPRDNQLATVAFGGYLDLFGRTPYLCGGLYHDKDGYLLTMRAPRGREGMGADRALHVPASGKPGTLPLLEPKGVLYSNSFYRDVASIWTDRNKLFPKGIADSLTNADKNSGRFLLGTKLSSLLESVGARHRLVVVNQGKTSYSKRSRITIPAFGLVPELRKPDRFARTIDTLLRTGALFLTNQLKMKLAEEKYKDIDIVGYRFDEKEILKDDVNDIRFAFSPCWARVGKQVVFASTVELCRELIDCIKAEQKSPVQDYRYSVRERYYGTGFADLLKGLEDQLITQAILDQAVDPAEAKKQVRQFIRLVGGLGNANGQSDFADKTWNFEYRFGK